MCCLGWMGPSDRVQLCTGRLTAGASAAGVLRPAPTQANRDNLTATPLAGHVYRQVYAPKRRDVSAKILGTRRGSRSAACAGWACSDRGRSGFHVKMIHPPREKCQINSEHRPLIPGSLVDSGPIPCEARGEREERAGERIAGWMMMNLCQDQARCVPYG